MATGPLNHPLAGARESYAACLSIRERLAQQDPANAGRQRDLAVSHERIGAIRQAQGDLAGALESYEAYRAMAERLAQQDPTNADWQQNLSISYERVGAIRQAQGDLAGALESYEACRTVAERLARQDPANADWQRDLSISHERIGAIRQAQGDMAGARESYEAYQAMAERLARQDPTNADWQRNLSISHEKIGDIRQAQGDLAGALESYEADMAIAERLARQDPANAEWQRDLAVSHNKIGTIRQAQNDLAGARESFEQVLAITVPLFERTQAAEAPRFLGFVYKRLVDLCAAQGDLTAALRYQQDLVAQVRETDNPPGLIHGLQVLFGFESLTGNDRAALAAIAEAIRIARGLHQAHPDEASRSWLALTLGHQSSALLLARQYQEAIAAAEEALGLDPSQTAIYTKQAHGYLLTGQFDKALAIYRAHAKDQANDDQTSAEVVLDDFAALRQRGIDHPDMKRIEALLKTGGKPAAPAAKTGRRMR